MPMRILVLGAGGVGAATAAIARRRDFFDHMVLADLDPARARAAVAGLDDGRFSASGIDASDRRAIVELARAERADVILNACDPRLNPPIFEAALEARCTYLDMAMTLSRRHPEKPFEQTGVMLGDEQFAAAGEWEAAGLLALVGIGVEPGLSDVFARYAQDHLFSEIDEVGVRDGADLAVEGYAFAPTFSIWTTIEECLNPPLIWERERGFYTTAPFSEPEVFEFPEGIGPVECVNVEHEEVVLIPRYVDCNRVTFKYGLGEEFIGVLRTLNLLGLDSTELIDVRGQRGRAARRRGGRAAGPRRRSATACTASTCAGTLGDRHRQGRQAARDLPLPRGRQRGDDARGRRPGGRLADRDQPRRGDGAARERAPGRGTGVLGPEAFDAVPFLDKLAELGSPHGVDERDPANPLSR